MIYIDSATLSLNGGANPVEVYLPLWFANGTSVLSTYTATGNAYLQDGSSVTTSFPSLATVSSSFPAGTKFALEVSICSSNTAYTASAQLWDKNSIAAVSSSLVSTTSTTMTVLRSAQFTLTAGHAFGVSVWTSGTTSAYCYICDASLIIFP